MKETREVLPVIRIGGLGWRRAAYVLMGALLAGVVFCALLAAPVQAFTIQGGTSTQRAYIDEVVKGCALSYAETDSELRALGPVEVVVVKMDSGVVGYSKPGVIYINSSIQPGAVLGELVAHEWAHQIWYSLGPKWWEKWDGLCGADSSSGDGSWQQDPAENFAECAKVALWGSEYLLRDYASTDLAVTEPAELRDWVATARYVNKCPFSDLGRSVMSTTDQQDELAAAGGYVYDEGIMQGYNSSIFGADVSLTRQQLATICERAGLSCPDDWQYDFSTATRGEVHQTISGLTWTSENWSAPITRGQVARLVWRAR
jgi:hypothetical protein